MVGNNVITQADCDDTLAALLNQHQVKATGVIAYIKSEEAEAAMLKAESDKLLKRAKAASKRVDFYRGYLLQQMLKLNQTEAGEGIHTAKIKQGSMRCEILDAAAIPRLYMIEKSTSTPDKVWITREINAGKAIEGAELVRGEPSVKLA
jgi:hypothetical protein